MCVYGCGYTDAIGPLRMGHIKCGTGHIIIRIHRKSQLPMWDLGLTSDQVQSGVQNQDTMNGIQY